MSGDGDGYLIWLITWRVEKGWYEYLWLLRQYGGKLSQCTMGWIFVFWQGKAPGQNTRQFFVSLKGGPNFPNPRTPEVRKWTVTHSASGFWRDHLLDLSAWLLCSRLPPFIRVLKSTFDSEEHDITQFFGKCLTFYGNPGFMMPFIHQTERTNKAVFSAIEDNPTPLPPTCFAMKFEVWRDTYVTIAIVQNSSPVYSEWYKGITVDEVAQKISCEYCVISFLLSTCKASHNNLSRKNELATFVISFPMVSQLRHLITPVSSG